MDGGAVTTLGKVRRCRRRQKWENKRRVTDDGDWNRGLNAWHSWRARAWDDTMDEIATRLNRSLHPDDSNSNLNDKIDVTEWSERGSRSRDRLRRCSSMSPQSHQIIREGEEKGREGRGRLNNAVGPQKDSENHARNGSLASV